MATSPHKRKRASQPKWRAFEQLASFIEEVLAPQNAIVKSPDKITDLVTGKPREVDASIRYKIGSVPILITMECRRRGRAQDDTWIEQLAKKREKIGAAKTIAVSSNGFSRSARKTAGMYGIELRLISEISKEAILSWCDMEFVHYSLPGITIKWIGLLDGQGQPIPAEAIPAELNISLSSVGGRACIFQCAEGFVTVDAVIESWQTQHRDSSNDLYFGVEVGNSPTERAIQVNLESTKYWVAGVPNLWVSAVQLVLGIKREVLAAPAQNTYRYSNSGEIIAEGKEFLLAGFDPTLKRDVRVLLQKTNEGIKMHLKLEESRKPVG